MKDGYTFKRLSNATAHPDGETVAFRIERADGEFFDVSCSRSDIAEIIRDLILIAAVEDDGVPEAGPYPAKNLLSAGPAIGIGFALGGVPDHTLLVVRTAGVDVSFEFPNSELARIAGKMAATAKTLSAPTAKKN